MSLRTSRLRREVLSGQSATCAKLNLSDPRIVELCGLAGFSAVWICNEHVGNDWLNMENQIRAARLYDMDTIVRIEKGSYSDYIKPFEADATAIMVPHVTTADEARDIIRMTRFQPLGRRPMDGGNCDGVFCQVPVDEYIHHSNTERLLIFQIESPEALEGVEEIAQVAGFDILLFGPGDYSHLIGKAGQVGAPEVVAARKRVAAAARANGKIAMMPGLLDTPDVLREEGWQIFNLGADVIGLGNYWKHCISHFHEAAQPQQAAGATSVYDPAT